MPFQVDATQSFMSLLIKMEADYVEGDQNGQAEYPVEYNENEENNHTFEEPRGGREHRDSINEDDHVEDGDDERYDRQNDPADSPPAAALRRGPVHSMCIALVGLLHSHNKHCTSIQ